MNVAGEAVSVRREMSVWMQGHTLRHLFCSTIRAKTGLWNFSHERFAKIRWEYAPAPRGLWYSDSLAFETVLQRAIQLGMTVQVWSFCARTNALFD